MAGKNRLIFAKSVAAAVFLWAATIGLLVIGLWSFSQTLDLFKSALGDSGIALAMAAAFQYGQNLFIFLRNRASGNWALACLGGFMITATVDAWTNVQQWTTDNPKAAANPSVAIGMSVVLICIVFVEELLMYSLAAALHETNEAFKAVGLPGFKALEWAEAGVRSGQMFTGPKGGNDHRPQQPKHSPDPRQGHGNNNGHRPDDRHEPQSLARQRFIGEEDDE